MRAGEACQHVVGGLFDLVEFLGVEEGEDGIGRDFQLVTAGIAPGIKARYCNRSPRAMWQSLNRRYQATGSRNDPGQGDRTPSAGSASALGGGKQPVGRGDSGGSLSAICSVPRTFEV